MKTAFALSAQTTQFSAIAQGDLDNQFALLAELGYQGVELAIRNPEQLDRPQLAKRLERYGLELVAIGTGQAFVDEGLSLSSTEPDIRRQAMQRLQHHIDLAADFHSRVIIGLIRGDGKTQFSETLFRQSLAEVCSYAQTQNIRLLLEPINRYETRCLNTASAALDLINQPGYENIDLLLDTFHMNIEEPSLEQALITAGTRLGHLHVADNDRYYPGHGHIPFNALVPILKQLNYSGYVSGEMLPLPDFDTACRRTAAALQNFTKD